MSIQKLLDKMLIDKDLMLRGFNTHGSFFNTSTQSVNQEGDIVYNSTSNVSNLLWSPSKPERVEILEDGVYKVFSYSTTNTSGQLAFAVNGVPDESTTQGSYKGAGQISIRSLLALKKGDYLTVKNHTTTNTGSLVLSENAGGLQKSVSTILTMFKIAPLTIPQLPECKPMKHHCDKYEKFRCYLLSQESLTLTGSDAYINLISTNHEIVLKNSPFLWEVKTLDKNVQFSQGSYKMVIKKDGVYDIFADIMTAEPSQITLFINGSPDLGTIGGRDSGGSRCLMRQFVKLSKGDILTVRNYESGSSSVHTSVGTGGFEVGCPALFMLFLLSD